MFIGDIKINSCPACLGLLGQVCVCVYVCAHEGVC